MFIHQFSLTCLSVGLSDISNDPCKLFAIPPNYAVFGNYGKLYNIALQAGMLYFGLPEI